MFSVVGILCALRRCRLGIQNLDALVMILKNWLIMLEMSGTLLQNPISVNFFSRG